MLESVSLFDARSTTVTLIGLPPVDNCKVPFQIFPDTNDNDVPSAVIDETFVSVKFTVIVILVLFLT